jgi:nicotinate-nucleotide pyrophosphorylase (carboxylating)
MMNNIDKERLDWFIDETLKEDIGSGDHTSLACIPEDDTTDAYLLIKDSGVIAGNIIVEAVFKKLDPNAVLKVHIPDGTDVKYGDIVFDVHCNTRAMLMAERTVLNTLQRLSGIATQSSRMAVEVEGTGAKVLDTRKTTPMIRFLEKWAVEVGGCYNYRVGLYDWIMIKDNHVDESGGITPAIKRVQQYLKENNLDLSITVEVRNLMELHEVLECGGITRIMFDNFEIPILREAVDIVNGRFETEASGGLELNNARKYAETGVNYISSGSLTHSAGVLDMSLKVRKTV